MAFRGRSHQSRKFDTDDRYLQIRQMSGKLKMKYWVPGLKNRKLKAVPENLTVEEVLRLISSTEKRSDLDVVATEHGFLSLTDKFIDVFDPDSVYVFMVQNEPLPEPPVGVKAPRQPGGESVPLLQSQGPGMMKLRVYLTTSYQSMIIGRDVRMAKNATFQEMCDVLTDLAKEEDVVKGDVQIEAYLDDGSRLLAGNFSRIRYGTVSNVYVVVHRRCDERALSKEYSDVYDIRDRELSVLLSPVKESGAMGLCQIALILSYLLCDGARANRFVRAAVHVTAFAPLAVALLRLIHQKSVDGYQVVCITACLHSVFEPFLHGTAKDDVFMHALKCASVLVTVEAPRFPVVNGKFKSNFQRGELPRVASNAVLDSIFSREPGFRPWSLDEVQRISSSAIVRVPPFLALNVVGVGCKDRTLSRTVDLINPMAEHQRVSLSVARVAYAIENETIHEVPRAVCACDVSQVVVFCVDASTDMFIDDRYVLVDQFISQVHHSYTWNGDTVIGLVYYNDAIDVAMSTKQTSFTIEHPQPHTYGYGHRLWDGVGRAIEVIRESSDLYPNATRRIVVFAISEDDDSRKTSCQISNEAHDAGILIDSFSFEPNQELCAVSHILGGICMTIDQHGLAMEAAELEAFLYPKYRKPSNVPIVEVTPATIATFKKDARDVSIATMPLYDTGRQSLVMPGTMVSQLSSTVGENPRTLRIMKELKMMVARVSPNFSVFHMKGAVHKWRVGIKLVGLRKEQLRKLGVGKWLDLFVVLPDEYPHVAPEFRFLTPIPYHINVTRDGRICLGVLQREYLSTMHITELIDAITAMLVTPCPAEPVSAWRFACWQFARDQFGSDAGAAQKKSHRTDLEARGLVR